VHIQIPGVVNVTIDIVSTGVSRLDPLVQFQRQEVDSAWLLPFPAGWKQFLSSSSLNLLGKCLNTTSSLHIIAFQQHQPSQSAAASARQAYGDVSKGQRGVRTTVKIPRVYQFLNLTLEREY